MAVDRGKRLIPGLSHQYQVGAAVALDQRPPDLTLSAPGSKILDRRKRAQDLLERLAGYSAPSLKADQDADIALVMEELR